MHALFTSFPAADYTASRAFYEELVGLTIAREHDGPPHRYTNYALENTVLKIFEWLEPWYGSGHSGLFIATPDLDAVIERIRAGGGHTTPIEVQRWGGRTSSVTDPFGNIFDLIDAQQTGDA